MNKEHFGLLSIALCLSLLILSCSKRAETNGKHSPQPNQPNTTPTLSGNVSGDIIKVTGTLKLKDGTTVASSIISVMFIERDKSGRISGLKMPIDKYKTGTTQEDGKFQLEIPRVFTEGDEELTLSASISAQPIMLFRDNDNLAFKIETNMKEIDLGQIYLDQSQTRKYTISLVKKQK